MNLRAACSNFLSSLLGWLPSAGPSTVARMPQPVHGATAMLVFLEKGWGPADCLTFLGSMLDTRAMEVHLTSYNASAHQYVTGPAKIGRVGS